MFRVVIIFIWILQSTNADDTQHNNITIKFKIVKEDQISTLICENGTSFVMRENIPTTMYIDYSSTINEHECSSTKNPGSKLNVTKFKKNINSSEAKVKGNLMPGEIHCFFLTYKDIISINPQYLHNKYNYTRVDCSFNIVMKYFQEFNVMINGHVLNKNVVTGSNEVDANIVYYFVPKERVNITCLTSVPMVQSIDIMCPQYDYSSQPDFRTKFIFQMVLEAHHNNSHIDCLLNTTDSVTVIRVNMLLKKNYDEKDFIHINGMAIRTVENETNPVVYNYYGDMPIVTCPSSSQFYMLSDTKSQNEVVRVCNINGKNTTITLSKQQHPDNGIYIDGLDDGRILLDITYRKKQRVIHYSYTDNDFLEFKFWYGTRHINVTRTLKGFDYSDKHMNSFNYSMKKEYDLGQVILKPEEDLMKTVIVFHYSYIKKDVTDENQQNISVQPTEDENTAKILREDQNESLPSPSPVRKFLSEHYKELTGGVLVIIFVLMLIYLGIIIKKRRKHALKGEQSDVDYVNLENNKPEAQFPKLNASVYLQPPKESEDYAVPVDVSSDVSPYSVPYKPTLEELYAKPTPKYKRDNKYEDEVTYTEIGFTNPENMYSKVNKPNPQTIYAEVHPVKKKGLYATVKPKSEREEYVNDFNNSAYANAGRDDVEPAYCEINALRK